MNISVPPPIMISLLIAMFIAVLIARIKRPTKISKTFKSGASRRLARPPIEGTLGRFSLEGIYPAREGVFPSDEGLVVSPSQIMWLWYTAPAATNTHSTKIHFDHGGALAEPTVWSECSFLVVCVGCRGGCGSAEYYYHYSGCVYYG